MTKKKGKTQISGGGQIVLEDIDVVTHKYMQEYSTYVNMHRAIPDFYDGLKPVHRRLMYAAYELRSQGLVKTARVGGDCFGKYHPHGSPDSSMQTLVICEAPTMHGEGNWGNLIDKAAASRYTECKLSGYGELFFQPNYIEKEITTFMANYDDTNVEPMTLPAPLPNVFINSGEGIGVGLDTDIPTFTPESLVEVLTSILNREKPTAKDIHSKLKLAFPWGGRLKKTKENNIAFYDLIMTGRLGGKNNRSKGLVYEAPLITDPVKKTIEISEWPPGLNPVKFIDNIRELPETGHITLLKGTQTYLIEMDKGYNINQFEQYVQAVQKEATTRQAYRINVVVSTFDGEDQHSVVRSMSVIEVLLAWLRKRLEIEMKSLKYRKARVEEQIAYSKLLIYAASKVDVIVTIIRNKKITDPDAEVAKQLKLSLEQAKQILSLQIRQLSTLDEDKVKARKGKQEEELAQIEKDLKDPRNRVIDSMNHAVQQIKRDKQVLERVTTQEVTLK